MVIDWYSREQIIRHLVTSSSRRQNYKCLEHIFNPLECRGNYSATSNIMKLVHWPLMGGLLHLLQRGGDWTGPQPSQAPLRSTKCNSQPINGQRADHRIAVKWSVALQLQCARQSVNLLIAYTVRVPNQIKQAYFTIFSLMFATFMIFLALQLVNN